jgi:hypothetical protein
VINWSFTDPSKLEGTYEEKLKEAKVIRDEIKERIIQWLEEVEVNLKQ